MGRIRRKKNDTEIIQNNTEYFIQSFDNKQYFNDNKPLKLEIGYGKGDFIINKALQNPNINFIGVEKCATISLKVLNKLSKLEHLNNLKLISNDAIVLTDIFLKHSIDKLYLNFSDPWPKACHAKRRLTSDNFLKVYKEILKPNALIEFKTDNTKLYEWTLKNLNETSIKNEIIYFSNDIYSDLENEFNKNNIQTEYEKKFLSQNETIKKIIFKLI
ncbi:MAG: tRNA (guanosine(46)-N7)-methyltransferase TrmB [Ureaplasma sp.]|nr:tRNA (guanosine(46)-N7)-methyltransferase TrmB [Ureaplasma sp.]